MNLTTKRSLRSADSVTVFDDDTGEQWEVQQVSFFDFEVTDTSGGMSSIRIPRGAIRSSANAVRISLGEAPITHPLA